MSVATGLDFMAFGLRVNQPIKTCCCGIWVGESLLKTLMVFDSRVFTSGSAFGRADCFLALPTFARVLWKDFPEGCCGFWKQKVRGSQQRDSDGVLARSEWRLKPECGGRTSLLPCLG